MSDALMLFLFCVLPLIIYKIIAALFLQLYSTLVKLLILLAIMNSCMVSLSKTGLPKNCFSFKVQLLLLDFLVEKSSSSGLSLHLQTCVHMLQDRYLKDPAASI
jgi:ABC-type siderophore export system fused ATPase/permease subunit